MGQKVHPGGLRVGVRHGGARPSAGEWKSHWYTSTKEFPAALAEDVKIRAHINGKLSHAGLSDILIQKDKQRVTIDIYTARPGIVIGKSGSEVDALRKEIHGMTQKSVHININEIKRPELDAKLVAQSVAEQLQNRVSFRRAMKRSLASAIRSGAQGVKISCAGRLGGGEMSRRKRTPKGACRFTRCGPTSTTASPRRRRRSAASGSRSGSTRARSCPPGSARATIVSRPGAAGSSRASAVAAIGAGRPSTVKGSGRFASVAVAVAVAVAVVVAATVAEEPRGGRRGQGGGAQSPDAASAPETPAPEQAAPETAAEPTPPPTDASDGGEA